MQYWVGDMGAACRGLTFANSRQIKELRATLQNVVRRNSGVTANVFV